MNTRKIVNHIICKKNTSYKGKGNYRKVHLKISAITEHQNIENHKIDWETDRIMERESDWTENEKYSIKKAIHIRLQWVAEDLRIRDIQMNPIFADSRKNGEKITRFSAANEM